MQPVPDFKIVPDEQELAAIQRELKFFPSTVTQPRRLTREQVQQYNEKGYVFPIRIFSDEEIAEIRAYFDRLLQEALAAGKDSYSISTAHLKHGRVYDLLTDPRIVECVSDILGDDVIGWGAHFFCKMPHDGKSVDWHQDASYWPLTPSHTVTVWLAIDDADRENACMQYIPGSHRYGHLPYRTTRDDEGNVLTQRIENVEQYGEPIYVELKAGEISMHSDLLLHGSDANESDRRRCGLTLRYCTPEVRAGQGWHLKGVVVRGQDRFGHWANPPRPDVE